MNEHVIWKSSLRTHLYVVSERKYAVSLQWNVVRPHASLRWADTVAKLTSLPTDLFITCVSSYSSCALHKMSFIHSQALVVQDGPLASFFRGFLNTHIQTHGRTPLDE
jgi:hypothetical protein